MLTGSESDHGKGHHLRYHLYQLTGQSASSNQNASSNRRALDSQTKDMHFEHSDCLTLRAPTLDF
jgi:hypothetical protein